MPGKIACLNHIEAQAFVNANNSHGVVLAFVPCVARDLFPPVSLRRQLASYRQRGAVHFKVALQKLFFFLSGGI